MPSNSLRARDVSHGIPTHWLAPMTFVVSLLAAFVAHNAMLAAQRRVTSPDQRAFAAARDDHMTPGCWATTVEDEKGPCLYGRQPFVHDRGPARRLACRTLARWSRSRGTRAWVADRRDGEGRLSRRRHARSHARSAQALLPRVHALSRGDAAAHHRDASRRGDLSSWDHYIPPDGTGADWQVSPEMWRGGLRRTYARLATAGIATVAIRGTPRTWFNVPSCLSRRAASLPFAQACDYDRDRSLSRSAIAAQTDAARGLPIGFVDMNDQICATTRCGVVRNGVIVFTDDNHLTASFTRSVAPVLGARLDDALRHSIQPR
jgi:hypothetical protein